ncbi:hypothetical protein ThvES_00014940 [Thiovulum sp. ES]|nr:hypothetical protein ThvES_00014940 [Thiovulum sp. ES]
MLELGVADAQKSFLKILNQSTVIIDKKSHIKKAVVLPYDEYQKLLKKSMREIVFEEDDEINQFVGMISKDFKTDDIRYNRIIKDTE